jgi:hypothetical protein
MRRIFAATFMAALLVMFAASSALGASPHFKKGGTPTCTISGTGTPSRTVTCSGSITGLGMEDVTITTTVSGFAVYQCQNPGGNLAPGQNRVLTGPSTTPTLIPSGEIKNGNLTFTTNPNTLSAPSTVSGNAAGCPNNSWTGVNPTLTITSIELAIAQGGNTFYDCTVSNSSGLSGTVSFPASC